MGVGDSSLSPAEVAVLRPYFAACCSGTPLVSRLHDSALATTYRIGPSDHDRHYGTVVKAYRAGHYDHAADELARLGVAQGLAERIAPQRIRTPEVVWASPEDGLIATRFIPGETHADHLHRLGRVWRSIPSRESVLRVEELLRWHQAFAAAVRAHGLRSPPFTTALLQWEGWLAELPTLTHLPRRWRAVTQDRLAQWTKAMDAVHEVDGHFHGDFHPGNILLGADGRLWILDWLRIEKGHWLEGAFRFVYSLEVTRLSPLANQRFYQEVIDGACVCAARLGGNPVMLRLCRIRAAVRHFFYHCHRPRRSAKGRWLRNYWMGEITRVLANPD